jgi:hypothetical protein
MFLKVLKVMRNYYIILLFIIRKVGLIYSETSSFYIKRYKDDSNNTISLLFLKIDTSYVICH